MKKYFIIFMIALCAISCKPKADFNKLIKSDYSEALGEFPDSTIKFYEVQTVLDKPITEKVEPIYISASSTIIQIGFDKLKKIDRLYKNGRIKKETVTYLDDAHWMEDFELPVDSININFDVAVKAVRDSGYFPESTYMTLRKPIAPPFKMEYFFGSEQTFYVTVDAITGELRK